MVNSGRRAVGSPLPQRELPLLLVSWTLVYEMFFYLLFAGALRWLREDDLVPRADGLGGRRHRGPRLAAAATRTSPSSTCCSPRCCWNSFSAAWWRSMWAGLAGARRSAT